MRLAVALLAGAVAVGALVVGAVAPAEAHVLPSTSVVLDVRSARIDASLRIPLSDLEAASGIELGDGSADDVAAHADEVASYLTAHFRPTTTQGESWSVSVDEVAATTSEQLGTGEYAAVTAVAHLIAPTGADQRVFELGYDAVIEKVITHVVIVSVRHDWATGSVSSAHQIGTIRLDTMTGTVPALTVDLGDGDAWQGFTSMIALGISHIREGTDHQLFLLTLLLPAPLLVASRRWATAARPSRAFRRIGAITLAFTIGHSVTLALGALGLPVPQQAIEALIAVSILVAAVHAIRPIFAGKEVFIAAGFGLVHGLAFSATLSDLDLTGGDLALSLLGFNLGIELMQLAVVALVLPPLIVLARTRAYSPLRVAAAVATGVAASGWLVARVGIDNPVATTADSIGTVGPIAIVTLWVVAAAVSMRRPSIRREATDSASVRATTITKWWQDAASHTLRRKPSGIAESRLH